MRALDGGAEMQRQIQQQGAFEVTEELLSLCFQVYHVVGDELDDEEMEFVPDDDDDKSIVVDDELRDWLKGR